MVSIIVLALLLPQQEVDADRVLEMIQNLGSESPHLRDSSEQKLYTVGARVVPYLRRAVGDSDLERRSRIRRIILRLQCDPHIALLVHVERNRRKAAIRELLSAGPAAVSVLRLKPKDRNPLCTFRAAQLADIIEATPVNGLRFGIIVDKPEAYLEAPVPGYEVFFNDSSEPIVLETGGDASVLLPAAGRYRGSGTFGGILCRRSRKSKSLWSNLITLKPGQVHLKRRTDLLIAESRRGWCGGSVPERSGKWLLVPKYSQKDEAKDRWVGAVTGNPVEVTLKKIDSNP